MMCPVVVANEVSGPEEAGVWIRMHSQRRKANAIVSGPDTGAGHEDQGSDYAGNERTDQLDAGGVLVFSGVPNDRKIHAFDASTGELLWEAPTPSGILAPPTSFSIDGKQYIAVHSSWRGDSAGMQGTLTRLFLGELAPVPSYLSTLPTKFDLGRQRL